MVLLLTTATYAESGMKQASHALDFRTSPKNILFSSVTGGASHNLWVLRVLDQLHNRGHSVFFAATVSIHCFQKQTYMTHKVEIHV